MQTPFSGRIPLYLVLLQVVGKFTPPCQLLAGKVAVGWNNYSQGYANEGLCVYLNHAVVEKIRKEQKQLIHLNLTFC